MRRAEQEAPQPARPRTLVKRGLRSLFAQWDFSLVPSVQLHRLQAESVALRSGVGQLEETVALCRALELPLTFVQIGANDGVASDSFRETVVTYDLPGVLVEPQPEAFERLKRTYRNQAGLAFENAAISEGERSVTLHAFDRAEEGGHQLDVFTSFDRSLLEKQKRTFGLEAGIVECEVPAISLPDLLDRHGVPPGYLLVVDTEGFDHRVVAQIDFQDRPPLLVQFEHVHVPPVALEACYERLVEEGYRLTRAGKDTVAVLPLTSLLERSPSRPATGSGVAG